MDKWAFLEPWIAILRPRIGPIITPAQDAVLIDGDDHCGATHNARSGALSLVPRIDRVGFVFAKDDYYSDRIHRRATVRRSRQAMELLARALRVDPCVWSLLPNLPKSIWPPSFAFASGTTLDTSLYRPHDLLTPVVEITNDDVHRIAYHHVWCDNVCAMFTGDGSSSDGAFQDALAKLEQLDTQRVATRATYRVPLHIRLYVNWKEDDSLDAFITVLERVLTATPQILAVAHTATATATATFQLVGVEIHLHKLYLSLLAPLARVRVLCGSASILQLTAAEKRAWRGYDAFVSTFGPQRPLPLLSIGSHQKDDDSDLGMTLLHDRVPRAVRLWLPTGLAAPRAVELNLRVDRDVASHLVRALEHAGHGNDDCSGSGSGWHTVQVDHNSLEGQRLHSQLVDDWIDPYGGMAPQSAVLRALMGSREAALKLPRGEILHVSTLALIDLPHAVPHQIQTQTQNQRSGSGNGYRVGRLVLPAWSPATMATWKALLSTCFSPSRLVSLDLEVGYSRGVTVIPTQLVAWLLENYPLLERLVLFPTALRAMDMFLYAYTSSGCRLRVLSIDTLGDLAVVRFFEALATCDSIVAQTLEELTIGSPDCEQDHYSEYIDAVAAMLARNHTLQYLEIVVRCDVGSSVTVPELQPHAARLRVFHSTPLSVRDTREKTPMAVKVAVLSAILFAPSVDAHDDATRAKKKPSRKTNTGRGVLGRGVVTLILEFAAPFLMRIVRLTLVKRLEWGMRERTFLSL